MKKYLVEKILKVDGIERFVLVKDTSDNKKLKMYFLSDMEDYVETFENMKDIKKGDILEGRLLIGFVCESIKINDKKNAHVLFILNHWLINLIKYHMNNL